MMPGLSEDIGIMNDVILYPPAIHQIRHRALSKLSLVIADGNFDLPQGFVWTCVKG